MGNVVCPFEFLNNILTDIGVWLDGQAKILEGIFDVLLEYKNTSPNETPEDIINRFYDCIKPLVNKALVETGNKIGNYLFIKDIILVIYITLCLILVVVMIIGYNTKFWILIIIIIVILFYIFTVIYLAVSYELLRKTGDNISPSNVDDIEECVNKLSKAFGDYVKEETDAINSALCAYPVPTSEPCPP